jgi:multidrug efflux pump subunit AcrB
MSKIIRFFVENSRMNYLLFFLIFSIGVVSYIKTPKEIFPTFELEQIIVRGAYLGASLDTMDKMAVNPLENELKNLDDIEDITSVITSGKYSIILELKTGTNPYNSLDKIKDALSIASRTLPSDMDEPTVSVLTIKKDLLNIAFSSDKMDISLLKEKANALKDEIVDIDNISDVIIYGDSDIYFDIKINPKKVNAFGLDFNQVVLAISKLSYIYPIGLIEDKKGGFFYISTANSKKDNKSFENSMIRVGKTDIYLKDIATINKRYEDSETLFMINKKNALNILVRQGGNGNAIEIAKNVQKKITEFQAKNPNLKTFVFDDSSEKILDRLNIVISNILLGIIIIFLLVAFLINIQMAIIIAIGIPTSFVIGAFYFYLAGYSINMISLIGVLIALGIIVDDAIVVSENIQQYLEKGYDIKEATIKGASEMAEPVILASLTTLFAFIPALMISGTMGEFIKLIPIAVSALVIASLVESFIFLPIHASHTLKANSKTLSWDKVNKIYSWIIHILIKYKKTFLTIFIIIVPLLTIIGIKASKFQMFPRFDSKTIHISFKSDVNNSVEDSNKILKIIQKDLYEKREELYIKHIGSIAGFRRDSASNSENFPYVGDITVELHKLEAQNFVDKYITPYLSFYYDSKGRIREQNSAIISKRIQKFLIKKDYKKRFNLVDISVVQKKAGPIKSDIKIGLACDDNQKIIEAIDQLTKKLSNINGVISVTDNIRYGVDEIKLEINSYGESLGLNEAIIGSALSNFYLSKLISNTFDNSGILEIKIQRIDKNDFDALQNFQLILDDKRVVSLKEVVIFNHIKSFEKLTKDNGEKNFYLFANIDPNIITVEEALILIDNDLKRVKKNGIKISQKGEQEKKAELKRDMLLASSLAFILIMLSMIYLFNSFRETFMMLSVIPFSILGVIIGHMILGLNLSMPSFIGILGLAGVVINDGIIMMITLKKATNIEEFYKSATSRLRPIVLTTITTLVGLSTIIFFPTGQAVIFQPLAVALGFGLAWGTVLNLLYLPVLFVMINNNKLKINDV